tara:strand:+ start:1990 stop:2400 length:411 start_codon:yes stop_codon:yes gene_type:complete
MISYKNIDILQMSIDDDQKLLHGNEFIEIKSPILLFTLSDDENYIHFNINNEAENHNVFLNLCRYIERLFNIKKIDVDLCTKNTVIVYIGPEINYKLFDSDYKNITKDKLKYGGKAIFSFLTKNGRNNLVQLLLIK